MSEQGGQVNSDTREDSEFDTHTLNVAGRIIALSKLGAEASAVVQIDGQPVRLVGKRNGSVEMSREMPGRVIRITKGSSDPDKLDVLA